jgi:hypothetical protein
MKTILLGVVAALALTSLPVVHADDSVSVPAARATRYYMDASEFRSFSNRYALQDGQEIAFKQNMASRYVLLDDGKYVRIYATSPTTFVTDSGVRFEFRDEGETVAITGYDKLPLAANVASRAPANGIMVASARR